ncbi:Predicted hydrolase of the alpha/beta superfamily [Mucilaginibacter lappiensis]|uniref:Alpha/beta superfamily hydrolase n=1 Tax=Mucilaginibacter lappiensis TaxID=354630 RepID=A0ABR6PEF2_9SPHI|nr:alpha/beta hydrolase-fold protein [Mucilaginibacter lappiensis]MBB6108146.1 putative alpha/beta superfamily hydrolase [Mucilaginibacter lappiensis]SIQ50205.1 Predicted hydrolase of the alpha/beta superfamily [Mucilaginibacter lappiensis]
MKSKIYLFLTLSIIVGGLANLAKAQDTVIRKIDHGKLDSINSDILKQKRLIEVFTPANYKPGSTDKYDVLYVLDGGNWNTGLILQVQHFLENENYMPPTIIVSIMGIDRNKDLTPTHMDDWKTSGGADKFLSFIKNELIPHIDKTYPSNGDNTLWGHSLGGLFVMYALLNEPKTFKSYIAVDPSLWWDKLYLPKMAAGKLPALAGLNTILFMGGREGNDGKGMKIDTMSTILKKAAPADLTWKFVTYPEETHASVRLKTTYDALKFSYAGFNNQIEFHPMNGIVLKDKPIKIWYFNDTTKVHYTLDGTVPTVSSKQMQSEITLTGAAKVTNKHFTIRSRYDRVTTGDFMIGKTFPAISKPGNIKPGGFNYTYYEGKWEEWPDFKNLKNPVKIGLTNNDFDVDKIQRKNNNLALLIDGLLEAKEDGYYIFILDSDKGSKLYLDNKLLMKWDGSYNQPCTYILPLAKGFHALRLEYFHKYEGFKLKLSYLTPSILNTKKPIEIPLDLQYHHQ